MPRQCCIKGCKAKTGDHKGKTSLYRLPRNKPLYQKWLEAIMYLNQQNDTFSETTTICSEHFDDSSLHINGFSPKKLNEDAVLCYFPNYYHQIRKSVKHGDYNNDRRDDHTELELIQTEADTTLS